LAEEFKKKVEKGEARYAGSGFKGKGYSYDSTELSDAQKVARLEKRQALIEAGMLDPDDEDPLLLDSPQKQAKAKTGDDEKEASSKAAATASAPLESLIEIPENLTPELLALPGMKEALLRKAGIVLPPADDSAAASAITPEEVAAATGRAVMLSNRHWLQEVDINDYPREARWKVTQRETTSRLQDEFRTAVTLKGSHYAPGKSPGPGERRLYLHLEAASERSLQDCVLEIQRILNEETLRVSARSVPGGSISAHKYNVL
jgi:ATP-dependent RNA helicase DDX46/PRP5